MLLISFDEFLRDSERFNAWLNVRGWEVYVRRPSRDRLEFWMPHVTAKGGLAALFAFAKDASAHFPIVKVENVDTFSGEFAAKKWQKEKGGWLWKGRHGDESKTGGDADSQPPMHVP